MRWRRQAVAVAVGVMLVSLGSGCGGGGSTIDGGMGPGHMQGEMGQRAHARRLRHQAMMRRRAQLRAMRHRALMRRRQAMRERHRAMMRRRHRRMTARHRAEMRHLRAEEAELRAEEAPAEAASGCDPNYSGACLDPNASDYDCSDGSGNGPDYTGTVTVVGEDHYGLDADNDGTGCESE